MFKKSISWNIRAPKYPFFNEELEFLVPTFQIQFWKKSIFEASEALQKWEGMILKKTRLFRWVSSNSELEVAWASLILIITLFFCVPFFFACKQDRKLPFWLGSTHVFHQKWQNWYGVKNYWKQWRNDQKRLWLISG